MPIVVRFRPLARPALLWLFYLGVLLFTALPRGTNTPIPNYVTNVEPFTQWATTEEWRRAFGPQDPASYALGGREIVQSGWLQTRFLDTAWPPGMFVLHAALQRLRLPVPLGLTFVSCCLWAAVFVQVSCFARRCLSPFAAVVVPLATLATELMRRFFLYGQGPYLSEGFGCPLQIMGFGCLVFALEPLVWPKNSPTSNLGRQVFMGTAAGLCLALAAYFRALVESSLMLLTLAFLLLVLVSLFAAVRRAGLQPKPLFQRLRGGWLWTGLVPLFIVLVSFHAFTLPYRLLHNYRKFGYLEWTTGYSYIWTTIWRNPATIDAEGRYFVEGGGTAPAILAADWHIDAAQITPEQGRTLALRLLRRRPIAWISYKLPLLWRYWQTRNYAVCLPSGHAYVENGILLLLLLVPAGGCVVCLLRRRATGAALSIGLFTASVAAAIGPTLMFHLESRYLHLVKVFGLFLMLYCLLLMRRSSRTPANGDGPTQPAPFTVCPEKLRS